MDSILKLFDQRLSENKKMTPKMKDILTSSLELFAEKGYSNTSTRDIATAANVAEGTIFKHFGSKENLLYATLIPMMKHTLAEDWQKQLQVSAVQLEQKSFRCFLEEIFSARLYYANENLKVMKVLYMEYLYQGNMRKNLSQLIPQEAVAEIDRILNTYKKKGEIMDLPNREIFRLVIGPLMSFVLAQEAEPTQGKEKEEEISHLLDFLVKGLSR